MSESDAEPGAAPLLTGVCWRGGELARRGREIATRLSLPAIGEAEPKWLAASEMVLFLDESGLALQLTGKRAPGPVRVDFARGRAAFRRLHGGGRGQMIARAVGLSAGREPPRVLDATAGLGQDAFVLAGLGCRMQLLERSPVVWELLSDGLARARQVPELDEITGRIRLYRGDAGHFIRSVSEAPDVIFLDPMFPHREKSALVKKEMRLFRQLVGDDADAGELLEPSLEKARYRVVVKRPRHAPPLAGRTPNHVLEGKSSRYDLYTLRRMS